MRQRQGRAKHAAAGAWPDPHRRDILGAGAAIAASLCAAPPAFAADILPRPRMPAEWEPHARCFMAFSAAFDIYEDWQVQAIREEQARIARAIARFEPVTMLVNPEDTELAGHLCGHTVDIRELVHFDIWTRDTLPSLVFGEGSALQAVSWNFNVWGEKYPGYYVEDRDLADRFAAEQDLYLRHAAIIGEGGAIEVDGKGTVLTTETCLLNPNRNPGATRADIETALVDAIGARKVIWLHGSDADTVTDGHVDGLARFMAPGVVVVEVTEDREDPEFFDLQENAHRLAGETDADGRPLHVIRLDRPRWDAMPERGKDFAASYLNCYIANGGVVMPRFGDAARDLAARDLFRRLLPGREIIQIDVNEICEGGGGIHCNTQVFPLAS